MGRRSRAMESRTSQSIAWKKGQSRPAIEIFSRFSSRTESGCSLVSMILSGWSPVTVSPGPSVDPGSRAVGTWASTPAVRRSMQGNRRRDTKPEVAVRRLVHASGLRYRVDFRPLTSLNRRADLVFTRHKIAVFIDGCFWHGCPDHHTVARSNKEYWAAKVSQNRERDHDTDRALRSAGWTVLRAWEHEPAGEVARRVIDAVEARRGGRHQPA